MVDYKGLIEQLRNAADVIEKLVNDRDASVDALKAIEDAFYNYGERKGDE